MVRVKRGNVAAKRRKKYLKLAIKFDPSKELYYSTLAEIHEEMRKFIDARENFEQAMKI